MSKPVNPEVPSLGPSQLQQLNALLEVALDLPERERESWLDALPSKHQELRPILAKLLARAELEADGFLRDPLDPSEIASDMQVEEAQAGETVGPYRLIRPIGQGGMAVVWLAQRGGGVA
ncbi:hypothetical protein WDZ92_29970, partial [Nostoc sp. NIES-2111]